MARRIQKDWVLLGMTGASHTAINRHVARLCNSAFHGADKSKDLLTYLVQEALAGRVPDQDGIAKAIGKKTLDRGESNVRMAVRRLRKALDTYYADNANPAEVRIIIPPEQYFLMSPRIVGTDRAPIPMDSEGKPASAILEPQDGAEVYAKVTVKGRIVDLDLDLRVWLVVGVSYSYYPQCRVSRRSPEWENELRIGRLPSPGPDEGGVFDINLVAAGADGDAMFYQYLKAHGDGFGPILPVDVTLLDSKRVTRRDIRPEV